MPAVADLGGWEPLAPAEAGVLLAGLAAPWWIAGGWAFDLFLGRQTRDHDELDIELLWRDQAALRQQLAGWDLQIADSGTLTPWLPETVLPGPSASLWCRPTPDTPWKLQVMLAPAKADRWCYRRCLAISRSLATLGGTTPAGLPYLAPEVQLLYKARGSRPKDLADHQHILPQLDSQQRTWLRQAMAQADPEHPWLVIDDDAASGKDNG